MRRSKSNGQGKTGVRSTRITPSLRDALKSAAMANGRSLSEEVEHRLRRHVARYHYGVCGHGAAVKGMMLLTADETASLFALLVALDEVSGRPVGPPMTLPFSLPRSPRRPIPVGRIRLQRARRSGPEHGADPRELKEHAVQQGHARLLWQSLCSLSAHRRAWPGRRALCERLLSKPDLHAQSGELSDRTLSAHDALP
jgi:hypothetical protein